MAGHSQFKNIMHRKNAQDKKRSLRFTKLAREITIAARAGADPASNPRLRTALAAARAHNLPKDNLQRALKKAERDQDKNWESIRYEGYGPAGVAILIETLTDNRNRTAATIRSLLNAHGGYLGASQSVSFLFQQKGEIVYPIEARSSESMFEAAIETGASDILSDKDHHRIVCEADMLNQVKQAMDMILGPALSAKRVWIPREPISLTADHAYHLDQLLEALEEQEDVCDIAVNVISAE